MPHFLIQAAFTQEALQAMTHNPQDRRSLLQAPIEKLGGRLQNVFLSFGDYDTVLLVEMPDNVSAAAIAMAISAGGASKNLKTTPLLTYEEGMEAARKATASGYRSILASAKTAG